jgi:hypothetical protein
VGDIAGRIVLVHTKILANWDDLFGEYERAPAIIALAVKGKAKAIAFMATREHEILYRHTNSNAGEIDVLPQVVIAREDGERIARLLASGNPVWANLSIPTKLAPPSRRGMWWLKSEAARSPTSSWSSARTWIPGNWAPARSTMAATPRW